MPSQGRCPENHSERAHTPHSSEKSILSETADIGQVSYRNGDTVRYGRKDSVRADVVVTNRRGTKVVGVFDLKTGSAKLTDARKVEIRAHLPKTLGLLRSRARFFEVKR